MIETLKKAKNGEKQASQEILKQYEPLVLKTIKNVYIKDYSFEDLKQECDLYILKAIKVFDIEKSSSFSSYIKNTLQNNINYLIRKSVNNNNTSSLDATLRESTTTIKDSLVDSAISDEKLIAELNNKIVIHALSNILDEKEINFILDVFYYQDSLTEYATKHDITYNQAYNFKRKTLLKIKKALASAKAF